MKNVVAIESLLAASLEDAALPLSYSWILMDVVSSLRRASSGWDLMKVSEKSLRKGNLFFISAMSVSPMVEDCRPLSGSGHEEK